MSLFKELQRRNVFRVAVAYGVVAWLLIQVGATLEPAMHLPEWTDSILAFFLLLGFPVALFFSWAYELTPDGLKRDGEIEQGAGERALASQKWDRLIIFVLVLALGYFAFDKYVLDAPETETPQVVAAETGAELSSELPVAIESAIPSKSIAVLPFVNMSSDPEQEYFSDGLTEELLNLLAGIDELKVAARTSSFFYKNKVEDIPMREIAQQLEVAHILEGSVRRDGDQIRITAQLIKADDGFHLWSETYDRTLDSIFAIQDEIAAVVVDQLKITLLGEAPHARVVNTESLELTLEARYLYNRRQDGDWQKAFENLERAIELDPENAAALAAISPLYVYLFDGERLDEALSTLAKALELEPNNPDALMRNAMYLSYMGSLEETHIARDKALAAGPNNPFVLGMMSLYADRDGDTELALSYSRRAVAADPLNPGNLSALTDLFLRSGDLVEAERYALKAVEVSPESPVSNGCLANVRLFQGRGAEALELAQKLPFELTEWTTGIPGLFITAMAYHTMGDQARANASLEEFKKQAGEQTPADVAMIHAWRGEADEAFKLLEQEVLDNPDELIDFLNEPYFIRLYDDPRWPELMAHLED